MEQLSPCPFLTADSRRRVLPGHTPGSCLVLRLGLATPGGVAPYPFSFHIVGRNVMHLGLPISAVQIFDYRFHLKWLKCGCACVSVVFSGLHQTLLKPTKRATPAENRRLDQKTISAHDMTMKCRIPAAVISMGLLGIPSVGWHSGASRVQWGPLDPTKAIRAATLCVKYHLGPKIHLCTYGKC